MSLKTEAAKHISAIVGGKRKELYSSGGFHTFEFTFGDGSSFRATRTGMVKSKDGYHFEWPRAKLGVSIMQFDVMLLTKYEQASEAAKAFQFLKKQLNASEWAGKLGKHIAFSYTSIASSPILTVEAVAASAQGAP